MSILNGIYSNIFLLVGAIVLILTIVAVATIVRILGNPFRYPYFLKEFDVSGKRNVDIKDCIDRFLSDQYNRKMLCTYKEKVDIWKQKQEAYLETCFLKKRRLRQYYEILDDDHAFRFVTVRNQTRYHQQNYVKTSYQVAVDDDGVATNWEWLVQRNKLLKEINYEATLNEYHCKNQRKLMNPNLRREIKERDHYTCQICGKYMPDEVGLHIDHIVPVSKGGKSIPSNLQVLCSKCNGKKSAKLEV